MSERIIKIIQNLSSNTLEVMVPYAALDCRDKFNIFVNGILVYLRITVD